jgi:hypothetical protein
MFPIMFPFWECAFPRCLLSALRGPPLHRLLLPVESSAHGNTYAPALPPVLVHPRPSERESPRLHVWTELGDDKIAQTLALACMDSTLNNETLVSLGQPSPSPACTAPQSRFGIELGQPLVLARVVCTELKSFSISLPRPRPRLHGRHPNEVT